MARQEIKSHEVSAAGPYSQGVRTGDGLLFLSGQAAVDGATGKLIEGDVTAQTEQIFKNLFAVLKAAGYSPDDVMKANVYLINMNDFAAMNEVYKTKFNAPYPARTTVGVASLPMGASVEIELVAKIH